MTNVEQPSLRWFLLGALFVVASASRADASSGGITTTGFGPSGCNQCHSGGAAPTVVLTGPTEVAPGSTNEYVLTIMAVGSQDHGGLNVSATDGILSTGGSASTNTQVLPGTGGLDEVTHSSEKEADAGGLIEFSFLWTAPSSFTTASLNAWGNAVNDNHNQTGDAATSASIEIVATSEESPTASVTPTATPTPVVVCDANQEPLKPILVSDPGAQKCQDAIGKAGSLYAKGKLKTIQKCLNNLQKGKISGDPIEVCRGSLVDGVPVPPTDAKTAEKIAKFEAKALSFFDKKCTDATVAQLDLCADNVADLKLCFVAEHWQLTDIIVGHQDAGLTQTNDKGEQKCQKAIFNEGAKFLSTQLKAMQSCLKARNKKSITGDAAALCIGSVVDGTYVPPTDAKTAAKISKAEGKMLAKINGACNDQQVAALDACADDVDGLEDCLVCTHRSAVFGMVGNEYGGAEVFADPVITLRMDYN